MSEIRETVKAFHIGDVLSAVTGRLLSLRHMEGIYDIMGHLAGESLYTHALVRAFDVFSPELKTKFPQLASLEIPDVTTEEDLKAFLKEAAEDHGEMFYLSPMIDKWQSIDPLEELLRMKIKEDK